MSKKLVVLILVCGAMAFAGSAPQDVVYIPYEATTQMLYLETGLTPVRVEPCAPDDELIGEQAGTTTYDHQNHGPSHRRIGVYYEDGAFKNAQIFWMQTDWDTDLSMPDRNMHWNIWEADAQAFREATGLKASGVNRAGYGDGGILSDGTGVTAFHENQGNSVYPVVAVDAAPGFGSFLAPVNIPGASGNKYWPVMVIDSDDIIHITCRIHPDSGDNDLFYSRSIDKGASFTPLTTLDEDKLGSEVAMAASKDGKVAIVYSKGFQTQGGYVSEWASDVYYIESTNGGASWGTPVNITKDRTPENPPVGQDTEMRAWPSAGSAHCTYDEDGNLHIVFKEVRGALHESTANSMWISAPWYSRLVHWDEKSDEFTVCSGDYSMYLPIDTAGDTIWDLYYEGWWGLESNDMLDANPWRNLHRPIMSVGNGKIIVVFVAQRDPEDMSAASVLNSDLYATIRDIDNDSMWHAIRDYDTIYIGTVWENITNLTNTHSPGGGLDECMDEDYPSVWPWMETDGIRHLTYVHDKSAGPCVFGPSENYFTHNPIRYLGGPGSNPDNPGSPPIVPEIGKPIIDAVAETGLIPDASIELVGSNVFSNSVSFSVKAPASHASLKIYDATGALVATVFEGSLNEATTLTWNADDAASGVYFYSFTTPNSTASGRLVLVR